MSFRRQDFCCLREGKRLRKFTAQAGSIRFVPTIRSEEGNTMRAMLFSAVLLSSLAPIAGGAAEEIPDTIAAPGEKLVTTAQAVGAQIYECARDPSGSLAWQFREPIATLVVNGRTVGRHYAGPNWEMSDGSSVGGRVAGKAPGASSNDIPLLKLAAVPHLGNGQLNGVTTIQRLNTRGGQASGACDKAGALLNVPYTADYAFYKKGQ
jgi:hypothetical protein